MATSFAAYASQFLNKQNPADSSIAASQQPLFFSFETDGGSRAGHIPDADMDDDDDPHLRASEATTRGRAADDYDDDYGDGDDEDPYLRLDEEDPLPRSRYAPQSAPLLGASRDSEGSKGWLAHHAGIRSPSPALSSSSISSGPPDHLFSSSPPPQQQPQAGPSSSRPPPPQRRDFRSPPPPPPRAAMGLSLTESLLPRDGHARPVDVFSLPDPRHTTRGRRKHNDSIWIAVWCTGLGLCVFFSILTLFIVHKPARGYPRGSLPYTTLLHTVPLLTILTFISAAVAYTHIFLLRVFVRPVMVATSVFIPATLFISALWAFIGSFMWDGDTEPTWGETVGLRLFAIIPLVLSLLTARRLVDLPRDIHTTSALLDLATRVLMDNPFLLALSPAILLACLVASIPFLSLMFRLLLIGKFSNSTGGVEWHVKSWANWTIVGVVIVWLWSWAVARGILRVGVAGVVGAWYFADQELPPPPPTSTHTIHAAVMRATQPSLGSIVLSALILTGVRTLSLASTALARLPGFLPLVARPYVTPVAFALGYAVAWLENSLSTSTLSTHALVYVGLTGDPFLPSAKRARALTLAIEGTSEGKYKRKFKTEPPLTLLTVAPLTLTFPFSLVTYLFVAHTLGSPDSALGAAVLAGAVTALVGLFCVGLVKDTSDTLYVCYCIDKDLGLKRRGEVFEAFEYETRRTARNAPAPMAAPAAAHRQQYASPPPPSQRASLPPVHQPLPVYPSYSPPPSSGPSRSPSPILHHGSSDDDPELGLTSNVRGFTPVDSAFGASSSGVLGMPGSGASSGAMPGSMGLSREDPRLARSHASSGGGASDSQLFPGSDLF